jgi:hypothetical protein
MFGGDEREKGGMDVPSISLHSEQRPNNRKINEFNGTNKNLKRSWIAIGEGF